MNPEERSWSGRRRRYLHFKLTNQIRERQVPIGNNTLHLVELRQMRRIHRFVPKNPVDAEQLGRLEPILSLGRRDLSRNHLLGFLVKVLSSALRSEFPQHRG